MRTFSCTCGNTVFFESSHCVACGHDLGWCPVCKRITTLIPNGSHFRCGQSSCGQPLQKCHNYAVEQVCNRCVAESTNHDGQLLCDYCEFNDTIPDLSVEGNREKWGRLEAAKRRLLYTLDLLGLPYGRETDVVEPPLRFDFKADTSATPHWWWSMGETERVYTGHANGRITINIREADPVEREKTRVAFAEAHRTVIGHFRHEIAHFYWEMLVRGRCEDAFRKTFGDHDNPSYADAQRQYYDNGPRQHWQAEYVSAYATMHPLEDFAETFATYLNVVSVLDTAMHMNVGERCDPTRSGVETMIDAYSRLGVVLNELNRAMGLKDLVPEVFTPAITKKMRFVHDLIRAASE